MTIAPAIIDGIRYTLEPELTADAFIGILESSGLAERRPVAHRDRVDAMLRHANLIITARQDGRLVGVSRALADFGFCCYLSDLAVERAFQRRAIGKTLILISAPAAVAYYPHIGMTRHDACFTLPRER